MAASTMTRRRLQLQLRILWCLYFTGSLNNVSGFYLPGVNPQSFKEGDPVKLKVNKMTSTQTLLPVDYYRLPFCTPAGGPVQDNENLGEFLAGDRIESSPYYLEMLQDMYCEQLCISNLGRAEGASTGSSSSSSSARLAPNRVIKAIRKDYHNNWIVDNLSAASKAEDDSRVVTRYWQGFPIGFVSSEAPHKSYIHNHVNIEIMYHPVEVDSLMATTEEEAEGTEQRYRIVRFTIEPFSIKHDFEPLEEGQLETETANAAKRQQSYYDSGSEDDDDFLDEDDHYLPKKAKIYNPIPSCSSNYRQHTTYDMVTATGRQPQEASGKVLFTYDVIWTQNKELKWADRWDIYLSMDNAVPNKVHWLSIANSLVIVFVLTAMIAVILIRNLRRDINRYNRVALDEEQRAEELEDYGWKLVHADVFRSPANSMLLSVCCGTGAQLLCMACLTIVFSSLGFMSPARRGHLLQMQLIIFVLLGSVNGYTTARFYKLFGGTSPAQATALSATAFPGIAFLVFFTMNVLAWIQRSTDAVPFTTMLLLTGLWFGISTPLVFAGAYFGNQYDVVEFPVSVSKMERPVPVSPWFLSLPFTVAIGGIMPFGACFVELYYILASVWMNYYYYVFGFLLLVFFILLVTTAEITVLFTYFQLCSEDYHWWWRSFVHGGSAALYIFGYSFFYFQQLQAGSLATYILYFGYMGLISLGMFVMMGFVGLSTSLLFNWIIFSSIKID